MTKVTVVAFLICLFEYSPDTTLLSHNTNPPGHRTYTFITNKLTWTDAQIYCRTHYTDLATIENAQENEEVRSKISGQAWIGLHRQPWRWSDKRSSYFRNWKHGHPNNNGGGKHCAAESPGQGWVDRDCNSKLNFWCHKGEKNHESQSSFVFSQHNNISFLDLWIYVCWTVQT
uniref:C-type lectin domain-containing protein n=1 Tax=Seriola lalandi dorsalis TaxID=1841481 RepID=A0A3B4X839_SERLL